MCSGMWQTVIDKQVNMLAVRRGGNLLWGLGIVAAVARTDTVRHPCLIRTQLGFVKAGSCSDVC